MRPVRGFTLIELVVVLALLGTLMAGLGGMLWSVSQAQRDGRALAAVDRAAQRALSTLARDFECAITAYAEDHPYHGTGMEGKDAQWSGEATDTLTFVTTAGRLDLGVDWTLALEATAPRRRRCDIVEVRYELALDPSSTRLGLYRSERPLITSALTDEDAQWIERQLCADASWMNLRYGDGEGNYFDAWAARDREWKLPALLEVTLEVDTDHARSIADRIDLREAEAEGARTSGRGRFFRLIRVAIDPQPDLSAAAKASEPPGTGSGSSSGSGGTSGTGGTGTSGTGGTGTGGTFGTGSGGTGTGGTGSGGTGGGGTGGR